MAILNTAARRALPSSSFAGPARSFPIPDEAHARLALQMRKFAPNPSAIVAKVHQQFPTVGKSLDKKAMVRHAIMQKLGGGK